jgi:choline dehydrogenase-like flavoprotein
MSHPPFDYDAIVIGTGFGGAVSAARLVQAGLRVLVLERGMRYEGSAFPALPRNAQVLPDTARYTWSSREGRLGLWDVRDLGATHAAQAAGYGGGSLIYANVQLRPPEEALATWPQSASCAHTRGALDAYYDLAAFMLDVRPIHKAGQGLYPLHKTSGLRAAAKQLGHGDKALFTPLAVRFDKEGINRFGKHQAQCVGCGECNSGCRFGAKSSLDKNYLAIVEQAPEHGGQRATIRTLAEAFAIERIEIEQQAGYGVDFYDHTVIDQTLPGAARQRARDKTDGKKTEPRRAQPDDEIAAPDQVRATARYVFVCAGALGSTELLFRSREQDLLPMTTRALGHNYFGNSDALGVVLRAKNIQEPNAGPVITTAVVHRGKDGEAPWLMVQDGGYGAPVHTMVRAFFESPAWLGRNRFHEHGAVAMPEKLGEPLPKLARKPEVFPLVRRNASIAEGVYNVERALELEAMIPDQLKLAGRALTERAERWFGSDVEETIAQLQERIVRGAANNSARLFFFKKPLRPFAWLFRKVYGAAAKLIRFLVTSGARGALEMEGTPTPKKVALGTLTARVMKERYDLRDQRTAFVRLLKTLSRHGSSSGDAEESLQKTAVLLSMGRDQQRHTLSFAQGNLKAEMNERDRGTVRLYSHQERFMREIASALGGELRLNPAWSQAHTPITVHGQGGCGMHPDPDKGVTDLDGQVHGCPGLYVMDAALFPSPVGVNPSATILAVAERHIERFIHAHVDPSFVAPERRALDAYVATKPGAAWHAALMEQQAVIDDTRPSRELLPSIGIEFKERMFGFSSQTQNGAPNLLGTRQTEGRYGAYEACYLAGRTANDSVQLDFHVRASDLPAFLADPEHVAELSGALTLSGPYADKLFDGPGPHAPITGHGTIAILAPSRAKTERMFRYIWTGHLPDGRKLALEGHKRVRDEPGQDEWKDTTALFFWLRAEPKRLSARGQPFDELTHGVARVSLDEFLNDQLASMKVTGLRGAPVEKDEGVFEEGAPDPATVLWAMASFGAFFFGNLADVYLREADLARRVLQRSLSLAGGA